MMVLAILLADKKNTIRNQAIIHMYDYILTMQHFVLGMLVAVQRAVILTGAIIFFFWRLDLRWIRRFDGAHASYNAMLIADFLHNNPVLVVFVDIVAKVRALCVVCTWFCPRISYMLTCCSCTNANKQLATGSAPSPREPQAAP